MAVAPDDITPTYPERVVLFGSEGGFSQPVLAHLLAQGVNIVAVVIPGVAAPEKIHNDIPVSPPPSGNDTGLAGLAAAQAIPVLRAHTLDEPHFIDKLSLLASDILLAACFPLILPRRIRQLPSLACWNLHPSLLPKYRGPAPLHWQLRHHERNTGVTLHEVIDRLDAGNIVAQQTQPLPRNASVAECDEWVAEIGVGLFLEATEQRRRGRLTTTPQDEAEASYFPFPDKGSAA